MIMTSEKKHHRWRSLRLALSEKRGVMFAVMLRDMRTRFFNHGLGFLLVAIWPLGHVLLLLVIHTFVGRAPAYGDSPAVFFSTGLAPTFAFMYVSRYMAVSLILNKPMLAFPVVHIVDIIFARALLEIVAAFLTLVFLLFALWIAGDNPMPLDPLQAVLAYLTTLLLAIGVGSIVSILSLMFQFVVTLYFLTVIVLYITSGSLFVVSALPDVIAIPLSFSPTLQCVEWVRTAYFPTYNDRLLDKTYIVGFALTSLFIGLLLERLARRRLKEG